MTLTADAFSVTDSILEAIRNCTGETVFNPVSVTDSILEAIRNELTNIVSFKLV